MVYRLIVLIAFGLTLGACTASTKTNKLDADARPVESILLVLQLGQLPKNKQVHQAQHNFYDHAFRDAMASRFVEIFRENGVPVKLKIIGRQAKAGPLVDQSILDSAQVSHILSFKLDRFIYTSKYGPLRGIGFTSDLWDVQKKRIVWKAKPSIGVVVEQPLLRSQHLAGQILNGLHSDELIVLKQGTAVDLKGERISDYYVGTKDR